MGEVEWGKIVAKSGEILCSFELKGALMEEERRRKKMSSEREERESASGGESRAEEENKGVRRKD